MPAPDESKSLTIGPTGDALDGPTMEAMVGGDLSKLTPQQRAVYYVKACDSIGVNYLLRPFDWIVGDKGRLSLYPNATCAAQLAERHKMTFDVLSREIVNDVRIVTVKVTTPEGRSLTDVGATSLIALKGQQFANAIMKAETVAIRRAALKMAGLGATPGEDMAEVPHIRDATQRVMAHLPEGTADVTPTGDILDEAKLESGVNPFPAKVS